METEQAFLNIVNAVNKKFEFDFRGSRPQNPPTSGKLCALFLVRKGLNYKHSAVLA